MAQEGLLTVWVTTKGSEEMTYQRLQRALWWAAPLTLGLACAVAPASAQTKLRAWNIHPDGYPVTEAMKSFADQVNKGTQGRYQIEVFSNATLGDQPKAVQMLKSGEIDLAEFSSGPLSDAVPGLKVLNLFGYTGGATLACAAAGATVCHVDASKGIVAWGKDNAVASGLADRPIRWLVDDCAKFVAREKRRGNTYDGIIMDPPSYGRGPGGEIWKLEDCIYDLISQCEEVLSDKPLFFAVNSYTTGLSPAVMEYMLKTTLVPRFGGKTSCDEIGLPVSATGGVVPCGATAIWEE